MLCVCMCVYNLTNNKLGTLRKKLEHLEENWKSKEYLLTSRHRGPPCKLCTVVMHKPICLHHINAQLYINISL